MVKDEVLKAISEVSGIRIDNISLEFPENEAFGDYSSNITLKGKDSRKKAEEIVEKLRNDEKLSGIVEKIEVAGPGFINFWLTKSVLTDELVKIHKDADRYGISDILGGQKIMFEYAHPNTHKAFHIGHLRNITTGETLCRLYEACGAKVIRANYQGDIGLHIAKALWGILSLGLTDPKDIRKRAAFLGKAYAKGAKAYESNKKAKEEIEAINTKIYDKSDKKINEIYEETRNWSLTYFDEIYKRVYTKFDRLYFESEVAQSGKEIALDALKKGILTESEGAVIFPGSKYGLHDRVFVSGKGMPTYEAKDLGLAKLQFNEYNPDKLIHTVGPEQTDYFRVVFKALEFIMPGIFDREVHVPYGWVRLREGKMSSRTGDVILGEDILDNAKESIKTSYKTDDDIAEMIAVGAVKYSFLKSGLNQDIAFDLKESISLEGNSGPYLQYTVARTNSVLANASSPKLQIPDKSKTQINNEELAILRKLSQFPEIIINAAKSYSPNLLCTYLYDLAQKFNTFYNADKIIGSDNEEFRLALTSATGQVLKNGLKLLGIGAPERM